MDKRMREEMEKWETRSRREAKEMDDYKKCKFRIGDKVYVKNLGYCTVSDMLKLFNPFNYSPALCVVVKFGNNRELILKDYKSEIIKVIK